MLADYTYIKHGTSKVPLLGKVWTAVSLQWYVGFLERLGFETVWFGSGQVLGQLAFGAIRVESSRVLEWVGFWLIMCPVGSAFLTVRTQGVQSR